MRRPVLRGLLLVLTCALVALSGAGCAGRDAAVNHAGPAIQVLDRPDSGLIHLPDISRLASASADEFIIKQNGADYAADLDWSRCLPDGTDADFAPAWTGDGTDPLANAAYSLYRLQLDPAKGPATLALTWNGAEPQQCWIGLADWTTQLWTWQPMPAGGELAVADPAPFADGSQRCYAAVIVLGGTACSLADIGFGELPPPPNGDGYTLFAPISVTPTYLIDMQGNVVHTWPSKYAPGMSVELTEEGHLVRQCVDADVPITLGAYLAGRIEEYDWDGNVLWSVQVYSPTQCSHHDFKRLPNGNVICIVRNQYTYDQMIAAGRNPSILNAQGLWVDSLVEIQPDFESGGGNVVWEWFIADHLIQDYDLDKANYGDPALHPELVDLNAPVENRFQDWTHVNAVDYNPQLDQIAISVLGFSEVWIIDHSTTTAEAAGHTGGVHGHGGDLLYRWGNPQTYRAGTAADRKLYFQHDAHWIADGLTGAGDLLVFNNWAGFPFNQQFYSSVVEFTPPLNPDGSYEMTGGAYGPADFSWQYLATPPTDLYSDVFSSAQRLPGGNTLICEGAGMFAGWFFEVNAAGEVQWEYTNPYPDLNGQVYRAHRYPPDYPGLAALQQP